MTRITLEAEDIPPDFPVHRAKELLDYDFVKISDQEFLSPLTAEFRSFVDKTATKNNVEFRNYRKFSADTSVNFDDPEVQPLLNEDKPKEQASPKQ